jgi:tetrahydromethanopterin S-methyltransferase subunit G
MTEEELKSILERLEKIEKKLDKLSITIPQVSILAYDLWHIRKELDEKSTTKR